MGAKKKTCWRFSFQVKKEEKAPKTARLLVLPRGNLLNGSTLLICLDCCQETLSHLCRSATCKCSTTACGKHLPEWKSAASSTNWVACGSNAPNVVTPTGMKFSCFSLSNERTWRLSAFLRSLPASLVWRALSPRCVVVTSTATGSTAEWAQSRFWPARVRPGTARVFNKAP